MEIGGVFVELPMDHVLLTLRDSSVLHRNVIGMVLYVTQMVESWI
jgi:hypothetical protein